MSSCAIVATEANELMQPIHDRMPVILSRETWRRWLDDNVDADTLTELLRPYAGEDFVAEPVSTTVNNARNEGPQCIAKADDLLA